MELNQGDVFSLKTNAGYAFMQFIETDNMNLDLVRILDPINEISAISQMDVDKKERWLTSFTINPALRKKIIEFIGNYSIPSTFQLPKFSRSKHIIRGEFQGWHIIEKKTLQRKLVKDLTPELLELSPHGFMNDTLIKEKIEAEWKLQDWK